jgi:hypothetical protein
MLRDSKISLATLLKPILLPENTCGNIGHGQYGGRIRRLLPECGEHISSGSAGRIHLDPEAHLRPAEPVAEIIKGRAFP